MVKPGQCGSCDAPLSGDDPDPLHYQVIDIPPVKPHVTEYLLHKWTCAGCGKATRATLPTGVHASHFGPNIAAHVALLTGVYRLSRRSAQRWFADACGVEISLGAISSIERRISEGHRVPHPRLAPS